MKDMLGNEVKEGDYFAYPLVSGRSANMAIYQFKEVTIEDRVKARPVERTYGDRDNIIHKDFNLPLKYLKWSYVLPSYEGKYSPMTQEERDKVDLKRANKRSTLQMFSERAILLKDFNEAA